MNLRKLGDCLLQNSSQEHSAVLFCLTSELLQLLQSPGNSSAALPLESLTACRGSSSDKFGTNSGYRHSLGKAFLCWSILHVLDLMLLFIQSVIKLQVKLGVGKYKFFLNSLSSEAKPALVR